MEVHRCSLHPWHLTTGPKPVLIEKLWFPTTLLCMTRQLRYGKRIWKNQINSGSCAQSFKGIMSNQRPRRKIFSLQRIQRIPEITLVLGLDETLVHSFLDYNEETKYDFVIQLDSENRFFDVFCRVRRHLEEFRKECAKMFELVLFTASKDNYANKLLDHIDLAGYIQQRLFRRHWTKVHRHFVKDLSRLGRKFDQTIIIDNSSLAFSFQPLNGNLCDSWYENTMDNELLQLLPTL